MRPSPIRHLPRAAIPLVLLALLAAPGCDRIMGTPHERATQRDHNRLQPFRIGQAITHVEPGVSDAFLSEHSVYLVTNNDMLVALSAKSTEADTNVRWDPVSGLFECPVSGALYSRDGLPWGSSPATRALERCRVATIGPSNDPYVELLVDPSRRFLFEDNQWSRVMSNHLLPEINPTTGQVVLPDKDDDDRG
ncbi:MAG: hypothetical protein AAF750_13990 [Planctomycetota bacterium]